MKQIFPFSHILYTKLYSFVLSVLLAYCLFNAIYMFIIGGTGFYLFATFILAFQCNFALRTSLHDRIYTSLGIVLLIIGLLYTHGIHFLNHLKTIVLVPALILTAFGIDNLYRKPNRLSCLKVGLILGLLLLAYIQYYDLVELQNYYDSLHNDETWQQFGAL